MLEKVPELVEGSPPSGTSAALREERVRRIPVPEHFPRIQSQVPVYCEHGTDDLWKLCFDSVNSVLYDTVLEVFSGVSRRKDELVREASANLSHEQPAAAKSNGKPKSQVKEAEASNGNGHRGDKLTVKQLRYLGYLFRKAGEDPDYSVISTLTQGQATMRIKELEQRVNV